MAAASCLTSKLTQRAEGSACRRYWSCKSTEPASLRPLRRSWKTGTSNFPQQTQRGWSGCSEEMGLRRWLTCLSSLTRRSRSRTTRNRKSLRFGRCSTWRRARTEGSLLMSWKPTVTTIDRACISVMMYLCRESQLHNLPPPSENEQSQKYSHKYLFA